MGKYITVTQIIDTQTGRVVFTDATPADAAELPNARPKDPNGRLGIRAAAELYNVSSRTLYGHIRLGNLRHYRVGGRVFVYSDDVERFIHETKGKWQRRQHRKQ